MLQATNITFRKFTEEYKLTTNLKPSIKEQRNVKVKSQFLLSITMEDIKSFKPLLNKNETSTEVKELNGDKESTKTDLISENDQSTEIVTAESSPRSSDEIMTNNIEIVKPAKKAMKLPRRKNNNINFQGVLNSFN